MAILWLLPSVAVVLVALYVHHRHDAAKQQQQEAKEAQHSIYVVGDLHGDVHCARHWVQRTGLVKNLDNDVAVAVWTDKTSSLVFMGDYMDKGPTSKQTIEFVKQLTEQFPQYVTALMGNHEMELLRDRDASNRNIWGDGAGYFQLPYAAVHPAEYLNYIETDQDEKDDLVVMEALFNASLEVYGYGAYRNVLFQPTGQQSIVSLVNPPSLRPLVRERMEVYQNNYIDAFRTGTELGTWLEQRPVAVVKNGTLFIHGGISLEAIPYLSSSTSVDRLNQLLADHAQEDKLHKFMEETKQGRIIYEMLVYRGNLKGAEACEQLTQDILPSLLVDDNDDAEGHVSRIGVGHTPGYNVRILCNGSLLALDSSLSRWFRASGNEYCRGDKEQLSSNGQFRCTEINQTCQGQILKIQNDLVEIIE